MNPSSQSKTSVSSIKAGSSTRPSGSNRNPTPSTSTTGFNNAQDKNRAGDQRSIFFILTTNIKIF